MAGRIRERAEKGKRNGPAQPARPIARKICKNLGAPNLRKSPQGYANHFNCGSAGAPSFFQDFSWRYYTDEAGGGDYGLDKSRFVAQAIDQIRALASGLSPRDRAKRALMMLQAFIDDSSNERPPIFVLAGYLASVSQWEALSKDWAFALESWHLPYFKMSEAAAAWSEELQRERIGYLYRLIDENVSGAFVNVLDPFVLKDVMQKHPSPHFSQPYTFSFFSLISQVTRSGLIGADNEIEFIFDEQMTEKKIIREVWDIFANSAPAEAKQRLAGEPLFGDDKKFMPLQAADLYAWWIRRRYLEKFHNVAKKEFPLEKRKNPIKVHPMIWTRDKLVKFRDDSLMRHGLFFGVSTDNEGRPIINLGPVSLRPVKPE
jgi:hypothetical protein